MDLPKIPVDLNAEEALLGAILNHPDDINKCILESKHFYDQSNRDIYEVMLRLRWEMRSANYYLVGEALQNKGAFEAIFAKLDYLCSSYYYQFTIAQLELRILEAYRKRGAINALADWTPRLYKTDERTETVFSDIITDLTKLSDPLLLGDGSLDVLQASIETRAADPQKIYGLETGFREFDLQTHGLQKKEVFILTGQPGSGKSMLAGQLAFGMAGKDYAGVFYSLEMSAEALYMRQLSAKIGITTGRLLEGWDMYEELDKVRKAISELRGLPLTVRGQVGWTPLRIRSDIARLKMQEKIEFVVIDYMDLIAAPDSKDYIEKSENISLALHNLAMEFDLAILVIQSMNKGGYGASPGMDNLSGSHKVSYNADQVAILVGDPHEKVKELRWVKVRHSDEARTMRLMLRSGLPEFVSIAHVEDNGNGYGTVQTSDYTG